MDATLLNMSLLVFSLLVLTLGSGIWIGLSLFIVGMVGMEVFSFLICSHFFIFKIILP